MFDRITALITILAVALGAAHIVYGIAVYREASPDLIWFCGAGVAMICAGQACLGSPKLFPAVLLVIYLAIMALVMPLSQIFFGLGLFIWLTLAALREVRKTYA